MSLQQFTTRSTAAFFRHKVALIVVLGAIACMAPGVIGPFHAPVTAAQTLPKDQLDFFESRIRPILADRCVKCHGSMSPPKSGLELDWKGGWQKGGVRGPAIVPGDPEKSVLIGAVRYDDTGLQMPPDAKLPDSQINDLTAWVRMGAPDPRAARPSGDALTYGGKGKEHWAFKPVTRPVAPAVRNASWAKNDVDRFVLARLEAGGMTPNEPADKRALIRRAYYDLIGLPPTPEQVAAFLSDETPNAFEKVVDALLASPRYGERWGRHWLDVARYSDTKGQFDRRRESSVYPYAWTYRDYVIKAFNDDLPYDQFIREQLAADRINDPKRPGAMAALGFLTLGDRFNGNQGDVINDRIDVTTKAFLGLTVTCARCHDHKFDPIPTADYYSFYGIFASSVEPASPPVIALPSNAEYATYQARRRDMDERIRTMRDGNIQEVFGDYRKFGAVYLMATQMPEKDRQAYLTKNGANPAVLQNWIQFTRGGGRPGVAIFGIWNALARIPAGRFQVQSQRVLENQTRPERAAVLSPLVLQAFRGRSLRSLSDAAAIYGALFKRTDPQWEAAFSNVVGDAVLRFLPNRARNQYFLLREQSEMLELVDPGAPARAHVLVDGPAPKDYPILIRGQAETPGDVAPRRFLEVLSGSSRPRFKNGSGRLELANAIASKTNVLTARVLVNRVWQHHFGEGFVSTPDDLGNQSSPPTHPELLDYLANRFMTDGWSIKKLHKVILLSATWQQSSRNNPQFAEKDPFNRLLWRANVRRLEFEPLRDSILSIGGSLDLAVGGHPIDLSEGTRVPQGRGAAVIRADASLRLPTAPRRTVYGYVDRGDLVEVLNTFDFPTPDRPSGKRYETIVPQQALFLMNSPLVIEQVRNVVNRDAFQDAASDEARIGFLYELFFQRSPGPEEIRAGREFVAAFQPASANRGPAPNTAARGAARGQRGERGAQAQAQTQARGQARGRGANQPAPVRLPLNGWQEYAHALLLTNEAAFVN
jgi:hypothetical protein